MAAWCERDDAYNQRLEDYGLHVRVDAFYECGLDELIDEIAAATRTFEALADETAELTALLSVEPALTAGDGQVGTDPATERRAA